MATPAAAASITAPAATIPAPASNPAATPANKRDFPTPLEGVKQDLAARGRLNTQYRNLLSAFIRAYDNPVDEAKKAELHKRLIEETRKALDNPQKIQKKEKPAPKPGIEDKIADLTVRVNKLFGEISEAKTGFENTKQIDDLQNIKMRETAPKGTEPKLVDRNGLKVDEFIRKNNELMNEFVKLYKTLNHKIAAKTKLIAGHIAIDKSDEVALAKVKKKFYLSDEKVKSHFEKQEAILKARQKSLEHLNVLNQGITEAFANVQRDTHYFLDCWVNKMVISRTQWRTIGNNIVCGYKTDSKKLDTMYRIENIKNLLPKPVGKSAAEKDPKAEKKEKDSASAANPAPAAATPPLAAAAPVNTGAEEKKKKKKKRDKGTLEVEA